MNIKHGDSRKGKKLRLYSIWEHMKQRCLDPNCQAYQYYGGRGIGICDEWFEYAVFKAWALANGYKDSLTIDRIDSDGDYSSENCEWITRRDNSKKAQEKFTIDEVSEIRKIIRHGKHSIRRIAKAYNVSHPTICDIANNKTYKEELLNV